MKNLWGVCLVAAGLLAGPGQAQGRIDFATLFGQWSGTGQVTTLGTGEVQELRCRVTIEPYSGDTRFRGVCASSQGNRRFSMGISEDGDTVMARSLLQGDRNRDTTVTGGYTGSGVQLTGASGQRFTLSQSGGTLDLVTSFFDGGKSYEGAVRLSR